MRVLRNSLAFPFRSGGRARRRSFDVLQASIGVTEKWESIMSHDSEEHHDGLEPKLTVDELRDQRAVIFTGGDGRQYQSELPGSWSNAKVAATATEQVCQECRDSPHFDGDGPHNTPDLPRPIQPPSDTLKPATGSRLPCPP